MSGFLRRTGVRALVIVVLPVTVVWAFVSTLAREVRSAFRYAWLDARSEIESARPHWRTGSLLGGRR